MLSSFFGIGTIKICWVGPDFYLGRFFGMFADKIFENHLRLDRFNSQSNDSVVLILTEMLANYFNVFEDRFYGIVDLKNPSCLNTAKKLLPDNYSTFIDLIKHSQLGNTTGNGEMSADFEQKYINSSVFSTNLKMARPLSLSDQVRAQVNFSGLLGKFKHITSVLVLSTKPNLN